LIARVISGFTPMGIAKGLPLLALEGLLLMTISIAGGTRLGTLANGVLGFGMYGLAFIGGWMEQIGTHLASNTTRNVGIVASLIVPSEALWQLAAYHMQPPIMRDLSLTPFSPASVPSSAMVVWAIAYIVATLALALWLLHRRDL
jgi:Cu-processing system permease protein